MNPKSASVIYGISPIRLDKKIIYFSKRMCLITVIILPNDNRLYRNS